MKKTLSVLLSILMTFSAFAVMPVNVPAAGGDIPAADLTYDAEHDWEGTLELSQNMTVKIDGLTHENVETGDAAVRIFAGATVNLVFEGVNTLSARSAATAAGIQVEEGSTVNIYGTEGSSLTVTGGNYSAGIGGKGYGNGENPSAGNINIYSGNITAIGGSKGAGIGSGQHSSGSTINIFGGNITALGTGGGAGIGSGYGTSGGASSPGVGFYNGGNITISGGTVKAASYHMNFDNFDIYNNESLYGEGYSDTFAAGIGGGYGASSGTIVIEGSADVTAIGSCGGAGIGSGRGTTKESQYDAEHFSVDVTIKGNSKVYAAATDDRRTSIVGDDGGAAIGIARACGLEGDPVGTVAIEGNANVYAVGSDHAAAIGGSTVVDKYTKDQETGTITRPPLAHLKSLIISDTATVVAVSDGYRSAIDTVEGAPVNYLTVNADKENLFENRADFFTEDKFPLKIEAVNAENPVSKATFAFRKPAVCNVAVKLPNTVKYYFIVKDYQDENGETIHLANEVNLNTAVFIFNDENRSYDFSNLTVNFEKTADFDSDFGKVETKITAQKGYFDYGSTYTAAANINAAVSDGLKAKYGETLAGAIPFDLEVKSFEGTVTNSAKAEISVKVPESFKSDGAQYLIVNPATGESCNAKENGGYLTVKTETIGTFALIALKEVEAPPVAPTAPAAPAQEQLNANVKGTSNKKAVTVYWGKVDGATNYVIYASYCGKNDKIKYKKIATVKGNVTKYEIKKLNGKKLNPKKNVKAYVVAFKGKKKIAKSLSLHIAGNKSGYSNVKKIKLKKSKFTLKKGKTAKIKGSIVLEDSSKKAVEHVRKLRFKTSNKKVATVTKSGKIKAKGKGTCTIYVFANNGKAKKVKVTVK